MRPKFDPSIEFRYDAVNAVVGVFEGQAWAHSQFEVIGAARGAKTALTDLGVIVAQRQHMRLSQ